MAAWQPTAEGLQQLLGLFKATQGADNEQHRNIFEQLRSFNAVPDYNCYLAFILNQLRQEDTAVRQTAGLVLKNNITQHWASVAPEVQQFVRENLLGCLGDEVPYIRNTVGSCITTITMEEGLQLWPALLPSLYQMLDSPDQHLFEGAFAALHKICEDSPDKLAEDVETQPLTFLVPKLLTFFSHANVHIRTYSVGCINQFVPLMPAALTEHMDAYLHHLFAVATDPSEEVRKRVCQALVMLLDVQLEKLMPHMNNVVQYMLMATTDQNELVALEACEFWSAICETKVAKQALGDFLPQLVPLLLKGMVYSDEDIAVLDQDDEDDEAQPDRPEDIKPRFHKNRVVGGGGGGGGGDEAEAEGDDDDEEEDEEDDDDDDDDDDDEVAEWNLRKCSASGLDILAGTFGQAVLPTLLPLLQERLASTEWQVRESGILALGAIAEGCIDDVQAYLPQLVPWLIQTLNDPKPLIRSITCWSLSRYSKWVVAKHSEGATESDGYLRPLMQELLKRVLDHNKKVQEAACSAFATLEEDALLQLVPYLEPILQNLMFAFGKYQAKNLLILYDAIGTLADSVGAELNQPGLVLLLMPPLVERWNSLADDDKGLLPLLECFTSIAQALGVGFQPYAQPVFTRCMALMHSTLASEARGEDGDKELVVCSLDLISGMTEGMNGSIEQLIAGSQLPQVLYQCMCDPQPDVRQSAYALVGDLAKNCIGTLRPALGQYLPVLCEQLAPEYVSVCNNASWAIGEVAVKVGAEMQPYAEAILQRLIPLVNRHNEGLNKSLLENTAITIGRVGYVCPQIAAPHLETFVQAWCYSLRNIRDDIEKEHAFLGLCAMVKLNPRAPINALAQLCEAFVSWQAPPPPELNELIRQILNGYKASIPPEQWLQFMASLHEGVSARLVERYQL